MAMSSIALFSVSSLIMWTLAVSLLPVNPFDPVVVGNNSCYMVQGYYPRDELEAILPAYMTIPDINIMSENYPDAKLVAGMHPFMLSFCHGSNVHDVFTHINVPQQEELMFVFRNLCLNPLFVLMFYVAVMYNNSKLCSYIPVLYLNSSVGVAGGLYYGLRKEYHPDMKTVENANGTAKSWEIPNLIEASFVQTMREAPKLPNFMYQSFANPFVTISYPPFEKTYFYQAKVYPLKVTMANGGFDWNYKGSTIASNAETWNIFSEYWFTMSQPMDYSTFFGGN